MEGTEEEGGKNGRRQEERRCEKGTLVMRFYTETLVSAFLHSIYMYPDTGLNY